MVLSGCHFKTIFKNDMELFEGDGDPSFDEATTFVEQNTSKISDTVLLELYGYFKQATQGPCTQHNRPGMFDFKGRAKYNAWIRVGSHVTKDQAQRLYVDLLTATVPEWKKSKKQAHGPVFSMPMAVDEDNGTDEDFPILIQLVQQGQVDALVAFLEKSPGSINDRDSEGCTALHWAADKGNRDMIRILLECGADVDAVDVDGQRPLEYALAMLRSKEDQAYLESALAYNTSSDA